MERWDIASFNERHDVPGKILERAKIPRRFWTADLESMQSSRAVFEKYLNLLDEKLKNGTGVLFYGPYGTGKTACAAMVLIDVLARSSNRVTFAQSAQLDWLARHRDARDASGSSQWELLLGAPFVAIDDVGAERQVDWNDAWFEEVVRARYNDKLPTVLTTNKPLEILFKKFEWLEGIVRDSMERIELTVSFR